MRYQSKSNKPPKARENAGDQVVMLLFLHLMVENGASFLDQSQSK